jgi:uncharacterized membrane protein YbhN (UPF0104 family)
MTWRRAVLLALSLALTIASFLLLSKFGRIDIRLWKSQLRLVKPGFFVLLAILTSAHIFLANWKWRIVDDAIRRPPDTKLPLPTSFALTSLGVALGQILPIQACMAAARSMGTYLYGSPLRRGSAGTIFEQSFDVLIVLFLAIASFVTKFTGGGGWTWFGSAVAMVGVAMIAVSACVSALRGAANLHIRRVQKRDPAKAETLHVAASAILNVRLGRRLMLLSAARSAVQVVMASVGAAALGMHIATWQLAASLPFVMFATVLAITPGGLGVTELTYATALQVFGIPMELAARWAMGTRVLVLCSCFVVTAVTGTIALCAKLNSRKAVAENVSVATAP